MWRDGLWVHGRGVSPPWAPGGPAGSSPVEMAVRSLQRRVRMVPLASGCGAQAPMDSWLRSATLPCSHGGSTWTSGPTPAGEPLLAQPPNCPGQCSAIAASPPPPPELPPISLATSPGQLHLLPVSRVSLCVPISVSAASLGLWSLAGTVLPWPLARGLLRPWLCPPMDMTRAGVETSLQNHSGLGNAGCAWADGFARHPHTPRPVGKSVHAAH